MPERRSKLHDAKNDRNKNGKYERGFDRCGPFIPAVPRRLRWAEKRERDNCVRTVVDALTVEGKAKLAQENTGVKLCDAVTETDTKTR